VIHSFGIASDAVLVDDCELRWRDRFSFVQTVWHLPRESLLHDLWTRQPLLEMRRNSDYSVLRRMWNFCLTNRSIRHSAISQSGQTRR
jgi:hypothetical protein